MEKLIHFILLFTLSHHGNCGQGARNPNLQYVISHASHVCNQHSFGRPLRINEMHITQFDHTRVLTICHVKPLRKAQRLSESVLNFGRCCPHSVTFGYY